MIIITAINCSVFRIYLYFREISYVTNKIFSLKLFDICIVLIIKKKRNDVYQYVHFMLKINCIK